MIFELYNNNLKAEKKESHWICQMKKINIIKFLIFNIISKKLILN